jgi:hypothetical protein
MLLIYTDDKAWTESERAQCFAESTVRTHELMGLSCPVSPSAPERQSRRCAERLSL